MMTWYTALYGRWTDEGGVKRIDGTYSRKEMFKRAQTVADEKNVVVTIYADKGSHFSTYEVCPKQGGKA